jgi:hypothetical protein
MAHGNDNQGIAKGICLESTHPWPFEDITFKDMLKQNDNNPYVRGRIQYEIIINKIPPTQTEHGYLYNYLVGQCQKLATEPRSKVLEKNVSDKNDFNN